MPSVLAIVSKAVFEKMAPKGVAVGAVIDTDRYKSSHAAFEQLAKGDAIFLVTVRPPTEALWLVGILEAPKRKGDAWVAKANVEAIRDITQAKKQLVFASGTGITAKAGALGMSLQTPRVLTAGDVALLRGSAASAYREAVEQVPAAAKARADAARAAKSGATLRFANHRRPFEMLAKLPAAQKKQLQLLATNNEAGKIARLVSDEDWNPMELVDVVDIASGKTTHQFYVWPYGCGSLFAAGTTNQVATIIQHAYQLSDGDLPLRTALAAAYAQAEPKLAELVDFRLDEEAKPLADYDAGLKLLTKALDHRDRIRPWADLTKEQQALIRSVLGTRTSDAYGISHFGIPTLPGLRRWMELEPPGPMEKVYDALVEGIAEPTKAVRSIVKTLPPEEISDVCVQIAQHDDYHLFTYSCTYTTGESHANAHVVRVIRLLAELIDASGDDRAVAFAKRAQAMLAKDAEFWLAAIATFALAARARRRHEAFPVAFHELATKADFLGGSCFLHSSDGWRYVVETVLPAAREAFVYSLGGFDTTTNEEVKNGRRGEVPVMMGAWHVADLIRSEAPRRRSSNRSSTGTPIRSRSSRCSP